MRMRSRVVSMLVSVRLGGVDFQHRREILLAHFGRLHLELLLQLPRTLPGWHSSPQLIVPENIVLMPLPPYAPELNSVENIWDYLRSNFLSHCVWDTYEAILDACCDAWNALMAKSEVIASIGTRDWAQVKI